MRQRLFFYLALHVMSASMQAQDHDPCSPDFATLSFDTLSISTTNEPYWDSLTRKLVYDPNQAQDVATPEKENPESKDNKKQGQAPKEEEPISLEKDNNRSFYIDIPEWLGRIIMFLFMAILVGLLVYLILRYGKNKRDVKNKQPVKIKLEDVKALEENLPDTDLEPWLREALDQKNYELAIRLYYLRVVQALSEKKMILWKKDKTNQKFIEELYSSVFYKPFTQLTYFHDLIFYGQRPVTEQVFQQWLPRFRSLLQEIEASAILTSQNQTNEK